MIKKTEKRFKDFQVIKMKTEELINNSFMVLAFDSSAILQALRLKKLFQLDQIYFSRKKYNSDLYAERVGLKTINIDEDIKFDKKQLIKELEKTLENMSII